MSKTLEVKEISTVIKNQPEKQDLVLNQPEIKEDQAEKELAECLKVRDSDCESVVSCASEKNAGPFVPKQLKTRADLIRKIKQSSEVLGNQEEIKQMRVHRRRRNSLDGILKEQIARVVQRAAEKECGIPQDKNARLDYAVSCLYRFDICVMKIVERVVDYCDFGMTVEGLAETIDHDVEIKNEMHDALRDFIIDGDYEDFVKNSCNPTTRLLLCHLYPLMSVLRQKPKNAPRREIVPNMHGELARAKLRSVWRPPKRDSPPTVVKPSQAPKLPTLVKAV